MDEKDISVIPKGPYCYHHINPTWVDGKLVFKPTYCPYWSIREDKPEQENGYCSYLEWGDWEAEVPPDFPEHFPRSVLSLLWDAVKECHINDKIDYDEMEVDNGSS